VASAPRTASLSAPAERLPGGLAAVVVPYTILAAAALCLYLNWNSILARIPAPGSAAGVAQPEARRAFLSAATPLVMGALHCGLMLLIGLGILRASPRGRVAANAEASAQLRRVMLEFLVVAVWGVAVLVSAVALAPLAGGGPLSTVPPLAVAIALVALAVPFVWRLYRAGRGSGGGGDGTPDQCWKLGIFYVNSADPAIFVEKRLGLGYTLNFGSGTTWLFLGLFLLLSLVPVFLAWL